MEKSYQQQEERAKILCDLRQRVKELECLYAIEEILDFSDKPIDLTFQDIVNAIPAALQYSDTACAKVALKNNEYKSRNFQETEYKEEHDIEVHGKKSGRLSVYYSENKPFLDQERQLIGAICKRLGKHYERKHIEETLRESRGELELRVKVRTAELTKANEDLLVQINERKKIENSLRESEERYRIFFENNPMPMWVYDLETSAFLAVNNSAIRHYGYSRKEFLSMTIKDICPSGDTQPLIENTSRVTEGLDLTGVWRHRKKNGNIILVEIASHALTFNGKRAELVLAIDITDRKKNEDDLWLMQFAIEHSADEIYMVEKSGRFAYINEEACRALGYTRDELLAKTVFDIDPLFNEDIWGKNWEKVKMRGTLTIETMHKRKDGSEFPVEISISHFEFKNEEYHFSFARDITSRKKIENSLQQQERFLSSIFASIQDGISILDTELNIVRVNPTMERWHAASMPLVGKKCYEAYCYARKPCKICPTIRALKDKEVGREVVTKKGSDGRIESWFELYSFPLIDQETGSLSGVIEYVRDITEERQAKEEAVKLTEEVLRSNKRLKEISLTDSHTGLFNYRFLEDAIEAEFYRAKRYVHSLSIIMLDIDYFKSINDVYGHQFGDLVLKEFAKKLKRIVRRYDLVIRIGGEEFVIVSPNIDRQQAIAFGQRLLEAISLCNFGNRMHSVKLKLSIAVASYPEDKISNGLGLIDLADHILNKAKDSGGNRVYSSLDMNERLAVNWNNPKKKDIQSLKAKIEKLNKKANQSLVEAIFALAKTIEWKDHVTGEHVEHTVHYVTEIAKRMDLPKQEIELVRQASMLHDLGKVGISDNILNKKDKLTKKEYEEVKRHPQIAADILRPIQFLRNLIPYVFYHHERWDGKGYPGSLKGKDIPMGARIIAIADVYEALTSNRPYRRAFSNEDALKIIKNGSGTQFDPRIATVFLKILREEKK